MSNAKLRTSVIMGTVAAALLPGIAYAGTPLPTESLGKSHGVEYMRTKYPQVVSQAGPTTRCEGSREVTGGGAEIAGDAATAHLNSSAPAAAGEAWIGEGRSEDNTGRRVTSWAVCSKSVDVEQLSGTDTYPGPINLAEECPQGKALGGGIEGQGGDPVFVYSSPVANPFDWGVGFDNPGPGDASVRDAYLCSLSVVPDYHKRSTRVPKGKTGSVTAACGRREVVLGGGLFPADANGLVDFEHKAIASRPWDSKRDADKVPDDGWTAKAYNGSTGRGALTAYATCGPAA